MYMCYTLFFSANSAVTVIMSSGDYIFIIYDMVITRHHFLGVNSAVMVIMSSGDYIFTIYGIVITNHHFSFCIQQ
jgi:hypothetical protein